MSVRTALGLHKGSASRAFMWCVAALVAAWWVAAGLHIAFWGGEWDTWSGYLTWGQNFAFGAMAQFILNEAATALARNRTAASLTTTEGG